MKKILLTSTAAALLALTNLTFAQLNIFPEITSDDGASVAEVVSTISNTTGGNTIDTYYQTAEQLDNEGAQGVGKQLASGVMTRNTILNYAAYLVRFISQIGLVIGALMIIRAGYEYASYIFTGNEGKASSRIRNAIIGVMIIIFSYAIMRIITTAFLS